MKKRIISTLLSTAKSTLCFLLIGVAVSCSNKGTEQASMRDFAQRKRAKAFIAKLDMPQMLELLLLETSGDTAILAKLLMAPEASVKRLMAGKSQPTEHALKRTSKTFADIKEFDAETIIKAALNNTDAKESSVWEQ